MSGGDLRALSELGGCEWVDGNGGAWVLVLRSVLCIPQTHSTVVFVAGLL